MRQLIREGQIQEDILRRTRISREDISAQLREHGIGALEEVKHAYRERSGKITFVFWIEPH